MDTCIFCEILAGNSPASIVHQDAICTAFLDIQPVNPGHILVIPNEHAAHLADLEQETGARIFQVAQRMAAALRVSGVQCEGITLSLADGEAAKQDVLHVHLHVIPRYHGDGFGWRFPPQYFTRPERSELDGIAEVIRNALES